MSFAERIEHPGADCRTAAFAAIAFARSDIHAVPHSPRVPSVSCNRGKPLGDAGAKVRVWIDGSMDNVGYNCLLFVIWWLLIELLDESEIEHNAIYSIPHLESGLVVNYSLCVARCRRATLAIICQPDSTCGFLLLPYDPLSLGLCYGIPGGGGVIRLNPLVRSTV